MDLSKYQSDLTPRVFGLRNTGTLCYLNSLIQALMGCSSLNEYLIAHEDDYEKNKLVQEYMKVYKENDDSEKVPKVNISDATGILKAIHDARKGKKNNLLMGRQEDGHEGLQFFLDIVGKKVDQLFHSRYDLYLHCAKCKKRTKAETAHILEWFIDLSDVDPDLQGSLNTKQSVENYIKKHVITPEDYKCDHCDAKNKYDRNNETWISSDVIQIYQLTRLSEIIVLKFNKYHRKTLRYFPPVLNFPAKSGQLTYKIMAQIEHSGSMNGGHYVVKALRNTPKGVNTYINEQKTKKIDSLKQMLANLKDRTSSGFVNKRITDTEKEIDQITKSMQTITKEDDQNVFYFSDSTVRRSQEGFRPTQNTYLVFYHLCK
jgi:uncharacterized UBP type Zn finger protein